MLRRPGLWPDSPTESFGNLLTGCLGTGYRRDLPSTPRCGLAALTENIWIRKGRPTAEEGYVVRFSWADIQSVEDLERSRSARFLPESRDMLLRYFGLEAGMRVLEVGCGPGTLAPFLAAGIQPGGTMVGVDLDVTFVERARQRAPRDGSVTYLVADAYSLPFPSGSFDAAVSYTTIGI